jgi:GT2 family glycosyltransferase
LWHCFSGQRIWKEVVTPQVDLLIVLYNSKAVLRGLFATLRTLTIPVRAYFLDNNSVDGTPEAVIEGIADLPFPAYLLRSLTNNGFARGMNLLAELGNARFMFILNPDTEVNHDALRILLERAESDPRIAICEARQYPREHPKRSDPATGETAWCSGAAALIRRSAFEEVGGFDERLFFMYCEDVDLSWRLWLRGWKCVYVRDAVVTHHTQDLMPGKRRTLENYFTFRNSLFLFYRFGSQKQWRVLERFLRSRFLSSRYSAKSKLLFAIALVDHIRYIPYLLQTRDVWSGHKHTWVRFEETSLVR